MASHSWKVLAAGGLIGASLLVGPVFAEAGSVLKFPQDITFKDTAAGVQVAVLYGDPAKSGLYVVRLKLLAGSRVVPHTHPEDVRTLTVLSGTLYFGHGDKWDESKLTPYPPGTFFTELPSEPHFVAAKDSDVVFQVTGLGPSALIPADHSAK